MSEPKPHVVHDDGDLVEKQANYLPEDVNRLRDGIIEGVREYDEVETRRIMRKIDIRLIPMLVVLYLFSFLDRGNIGNANAAGLSTDLKLSGTQYNIALTVFSIPYAIFEVPSNMVLKTIRPSIWIPVLLLCWGTVMTLMGIVQSFRGLVAARFFLGLSECGFFPAATFLLTIWYKRYEIQTRMAVFYASASLSGAFSGLLAFAIQKMDGVGGLEGWRWIFILEGLLPVTASVFAYFLLPDRPATAKFLTQDERDFVIHRIQIETGSSTGKVTNEDPLRKRYIIAALKEWKIWMALFIYWGNSVAVIGFTYTAPIVIKQLGYSTGIAQLLTVPIYICAMFCTIFISYLSGRYRQRSPFIIISYGASLLGFIALLAIPHPKMPGLTYGFLFLAASGLYAPLICLISWIANNLAPSSKRAIGMALLISLGNLGGIIGSNIYLAREAPHYWTGYGFSLAILVVAIITTVILRICYARINKEREEMDPVAIEQQYTLQELLDMGDKSPIFRYSL
ncbi:major facilitator superfamily domain-containing protein [Xylogone sp. PMI_703]|nr:major facilitator superfamily domain-containing protein [Xylogone sp. PMI_703]